MKLKRLNRKGGRESETERERIGLVFWEPQPLCSQGWAQVDSPSSLEDELADELARNQGHPGHVEKLHKKPEVTPFLILI